MEDGALLLVTILVSLSPVASIGLRIWIPFNCSGMFEETCGTVVKWPSVVFFSPFSQTESMGRVTVISPDGETDEATWQARDLACSLLLTNSMEPSLQGTLGVLLVVAIFSALEQRRGFPTFQGEDWLVGISQASGDDGEGLRYRQSSLEKIPSRVGTIGCESGKTKGEDCFPREIQIHLGSLFFKMSPPTECSPAGLRMLIKCAWWLLTDSKHNCHHRCNNNSRWNLLCSVPEKGEKLSGEAHAGRQARRVPRGNARFTARSKPKPFTTDSAKEEENYSKESQSHLHIQ